MSYWFVELCCFGLFATVFNVLRHSCVLKVSHITTDFLRTPITKMIIFNQGLHNIIVIYCYILLKYTLFPLALV